MKDTIVSSPLPDLSIPNITIHELAFVKFQTFGSGIALVCIHLRKIASSYVTYT